MTAPNRLARALRHQAQGLYCLEAAAELLIAHRSWLDRADFVEFVDVRHGIVDGRSMAAIDWSQAVIALQA